MPTFDFKTYISPFTWRYGSTEMRQIFSEQHKYELWRKIWVTVAQVQKNAGLVSLEELEDLQKNQNEINIERILEIEKETKHDTVAAIKEFAEKAKVGGGKIHLGLTSMDVVDNTQALQTKEALILVEKNLKEVMKLFAQKAEEFAETVCLGYTHLQPAEPTTVGYRIAFYLQDLLIDYETLQFIKSLPFGKGIKGAVGTQASFSQLYKNKNIEPLQMEKEIMQILDIRSVDISTQVYSRKIDFLVLTLLTSISSSVAKFAADLRILQSPTIGEWSEPFGTTQVGSSAMPFKKNPINSEKICSLSRMIEGYPQVALQNASHSYLERTLDDSANRRVIMPEAFLAVDEILMTAKKIISGLVINKERIAYNLSLYAPFLASESILMESSKKGADRQKMHEVLREIAMKAWAEVAQGKENSMSSMLKESPDIVKYVSKEDLEKLIDVTSHIGTAVKRAKEIANKVKQL